MSIYYSYPNPAWGTAIGHHGYHLLGLYTRHFSKCSCLFHWFLTVILWCRHCYYLPFKDEDTRHSEVKGLAQHHTDGNCGAWFFPSRAHGLCSEENVKGFPGHLRLCKAREKLLWMLSHLWSVSTMVTVDRHPRHPTQTGRQNCSHSSRTHDPPNNK